MISFPGSHYRQFWLPLQHLFYGIIQDKQILREFQHNNQNLQAFPLL